MNILVITRLFPNKLDTINGIFVKEICDGLSKCENINLSVISPIPKSNALLGLINTKYKQYNEHPILDKVGQYTTFYPRYSKFLSKLFPQYEYKPYYKCILNLVKREKFRPDVIYCHWLFPDSVACTKLAEYLNIPIILHSHEANLDFHLKHEGFSELISQAVKRSNITYCVSENARNTLINRLNVGNLNNIKLLYNGVDTSLFYHKNNKEELRRKYKFSNHDRILISVGAMDRKKGQYNLIEAINELVWNRERNIKLILVGNGPEYENYSNMIKEYNLENYIFMFGSREKSEICDLLNMSDVFTLTSNFESFGIVFLEALACGIPIVATRVGGIPEIVNNEKYGLLVERDNIEQLKTAICSALNKKWDVDELIHRANEFSLRKQINSIIDDASKL